MWDYCDSEDETIDNDDDIDDKLEQNNYPKYSTNPRNSVTVT
jgi:hypothetical protein